MNPNSLSILIVDDMQFSRESIRQSLKKSGSEQLWMAESAEKALECIAENAPDVILVDKMMPKVNGLELIEQIRESDKANDKHTFIILLTADESDNALKEAMLCGADHYLYKDATGGKIINCIEYIETQFRAKQILAELEVQEQRQRHATEKLSHPEANSDEMKAFMAYKGPRPQELSYLIVDDEEFAAISVSQALEKLGIKNVRIARHALEALKLHKKERADILLIDYMMPKVDGIRLTEMIRDKEEDDSTPIIMVTAAASIKKIEEAILAGVDEYLYKPPSLNDLAEKMEAAFKKHNPSHELSQLKWSHFL